jgi:hypothetical protein
MAINKTLEELFGAGATQTIESVTFLKASLKSSRVPIAFAALLASVNNTAESLFLALLLMAWERQDTSQDAELKIAGPAVNVIPVVKDGVEAIADEYQFLVTITAPRATFNNLPDPNRI